MPRYVSSRPYRSRKRSLSGRKRSYKGRSKSSLSYRRRRSFKSISKRRGSRKKVTGAMVTLGNKSIPAMKKVALPWRQEAMSTIRYDASQGGKVYIASQQYSASSACFNLGTQQIPGATLNPFVSPRWDIYASKYQRVKCTTSSWTFEFSQNSQLSNDPETKVQLRTHNQITFGVYLSDTEITPPIGFLCDFQKLKLAGNLKYKTVNQFSAPCKITVDVDYPKCVQSDPVYTTSQCWTLEAMGDGGTLIPARKDANYPGSSQLFLIPFVVYNSATRTDGTDTSVNIRVNNVKHCIFDRPVQNIQFVNNAAQINYPPLKPDLPSTFVLRNLFP